MTGVPTAPAPPAVFVAGDIFAITTGGTLCDRLILSHLERLGEVRFHRAPLRRWPFSGKPGLAGLLANVRNLFVRFPRRAVVWIDHGCYRDVFLAAWVWRFLWRVRIVNILYPLDYNVGAGWRRGGRRLTEGSLLRAADEVITISRPTAGQAVGLGAAPDRWSLMPVSRRFDPAEVAAPDRSGRGADAPVVFRFVGTVEPRKGLADAIAALRAWPGPRPLVFRCAGIFDPGGEHYRELAAPAAGLPAARVEFLGRLTHAALEQEFLAADAFLFPSHWEGYGIAVEEAFCFGLPVIACAAGSIPEVFSAGATEGGLGPPGDPAALAAAVR